MGKTVAAEETESDRARKAKTAFFVGLFDLTWRMLVGMLLPIFVGLFLMHNLEPIKFLPLSAL